MYQDWVSPSFSTEQLTEFCVEFFKSENIPTSLVKASKDKTTIQAQIEGINEEIQITIEKEESRLRLTYPVAGHATGTVARLLGIFLTGWFIKAGTEKQLALELLEQQFWKYLDGKLEDYELSIRSSAQNI